MESWANLCRSCLSPDTNISLLDDENNVREKFLEITTIEIDQNDGLPQRLCWDCFNVMNTAYQFRKQCIKMDTELKLQLENLIQQSQNNETQELETNEDVAYMTDSQASKDSVYETEVLSDDPMKQIEEIIKKEPNDSDDDYYYVLVIDDPKDKESQQVEVDIAPEEQPAVEVKDITDVKNIKQEVIEVKKEIVTQKKDKPSETFETAYDSFLMSNNRVPINVPATILENEEESQENEDLYDNDYSMDAETQDSNSQGLNLNQHEELHEKDIEIITSDLNEPQDTSIIKILTTTGADGTIYLKDNNGIQYLTTSDGQLVTTNSDGDSINQEEVIFCEGEDSSQFQILKCDGSELVIEYTDGDQIATVIQQEDGTFLCECGEQFADLGDYEKHQYKHNPAGEHLCNLCGKGFETAEILTGHMLLHSVSGMLVNCSFCNQLIRRNSLTQHIKYSHSSAKPECNICSKTFANPNNLKRHQMIHTGVRDYECDICQKRFHQKITMQTHRMTHMDSFCCNECDQTFKTKENLLEHKGNNECTKSKVKKVKEELMKTVRQQVTTNVGKLLGYACSLCKKMFSLESALEQHVEATHMVDPSELLCSECGEVLPTKKDMQIHVLSHKNVKPKNLKRVECKTCGKNCSSQAMLIMHERVHTNERPYPCELCSLRFKTKTHLRTHQLTHTREKKFGCSVCMKFFALKGNLVVHLRTHTGERPYVCNLCNEAFIDSKYLKKHKLKKHAISATWQFNT